MTNFDALIRVQAKSCLDLLGGIPATYIFNGDIRTKVLIERDVEVVTDGGLAFVKRTVVSLLKSDVGRVEMKALISTSSETFVVEGLVTEDDQMVQVYVRSNN